MGGVLLPAVFVRMLGGIRGGAVLLVSREDGFFPFGHEIAREQKNANGCYGNDDSCHALPPFARKSGLAMVYE